MGEYGWFVDDYNGFKLCVQDMGRCMIMMSEFQMNYITKRLGKLNIKELMRYYTPKSFFNLFDVAVVYGNSFPRDIEFYTVNEDYKEIWSYLRREDFGRNSLIDMGFEKQYGCYVVDVCCPEFIDYLIHFNKRFYCSSGKSSWVEMVKKNGWSDVEVEEGYLKYKSACDEWFDNEYGVHIKLI